MNVSTTTSTVGGTYVVIVKIFVVTNVAVVFVVTVVIVVVFVGLVVVLFDVVL